MSMHCEHCGKEVTSSYCHACGKAATKGSSSRRKMLGVCAIVGPFFGVFATLSLYAIASFVVSAVMTASDSSAGNVELVGNVVNVLLGVLGMLSVAGILVGIPLGIYLLVTDGKPKDGVAQQVKKG